MNDKVEIVNKNGIIVAKIGLIQAILLAILSIIGPIVVYHFTKAPSDHDKQQKISSCSRDTIQVLEEKIFIIEKNYKSWVDNYHARMNSPGGDNQNLAGLHEMLYKDVVEAIASKNKALERVKSCFDK